MFLRYTKRANTFSEASQNPWIGVFGKSLRNFGNSIGELERRLMHLLLLPVSSMLYTGGQKELLTCGADTILVCGRWDQPLSVFVEVKTLSPCSICFFA